MRVRLSIVIPVYDNWWLTARALRTLDELRKDIREPFETIVVDNASRDETPQAIAAFPWVRYERMERNTNFAGACNAGVHLAQAPITLLLNNDAYPLGDALTPLVEAFEREDVAIAGGALFFEDGVTQAAGLVVLPNAHWHYFCRNLPPALADVTASRDALAVSGAAMAVRTQWFCESGGFDESFVNGFEDVDLCMRAREQRCAIAYVASARFAHYEGASAGRFDREAENERRYYQRWSSDFGAIARTGRGSVGAIALQTGDDATPLALAARDDLEAALRTFGHPVVQGGIPAWRRFDRRFRDQATIGWFTSNAAEPGITVERASASLATVRTHGAANVVVPWLPCASVDRVATLGVRLSDDPLCDRFAVAGADEDVAHFISSVSRLHTIRVTPQMLLNGNNGGSVDVAGVVHLGVTDEAAFGNVLLAQAGLPAVVSARGDLRALFAADVALTASSRELEERALQLVDDVRLRARYGALVAADARRRFSPRRAAIRIVDLLCAARFGFERPAAARSDTPIPL